MFGLDAAAASDCSVFDPNLGSDGSAVQREGGPEVLLALGKANAPSPERPRGLLAQAWRRPARLVTRSPKENAGDLAR